MILRTKNAKFSPCGVLSQIASHISTTGLSKIVICRRRRVFGGGPECLKWSPTPHFYRSFYRSLWWNSYNLKYGFSIGGLPRPTSACNPQSCLAFDKRKVQRNLQGKCTPNQIASFVSYLKIYTFFFEKWISWILKLLVKMCKTLFWLITQKPLDLLKF